ncbi:MAG: acyl-CoA carboxylase subunit beta [Burkholderiaceae bacterium]
MSWQPELDDLARRQALAAQMGGEEKIARHRAGGKLPVRERISALADAGSFQETGSISGVPVYDDSGNIIDLTPTNVVCGQASINNRPVFITGDDFTVRGGASDGGSKDKFVFAETYASRWKIPLIRLVDGTGGGGSVKHLETAGHTFLPDVPEFSEMADALGKVPVVALGLGSVAGMGAARVCASHYSVMVQGSAQLFAAGPPVVARAGETLTKEELGGASIHVANGTVDDAVATEERAFVQARQFLSYLPSSAEDLPPRALTDDPGDRSEESLLSAIPREARKVYKIRPILETIFDQKSWFEIGRGWGKSVVTGLARIDGWPVAVLASDPYHYGGAWTSDACRKAIRLVDLAETFHLPVVHLVDIPGFRIGLDAERSGVMRAGSQALVAIRQSKVPWCAIVIRKAYGMAALTQRNGSHSFVRYAWPSAEWGSLPIAGGVQAAYRAEIEAAEDPDAARAEIEARLAKVQSPLRSAHAFNVEEIIDPRQTRCYLSKFANLAAPLRRGEPRQFTYRP